jgi:hypothetical protein
VLISTFTAKPKATATVKAVAFGSAVNRNVEVIDDINSPLVQFSAVSFNAEQPTLAVILCR